MMKNVLSNIKERAKQLKADIPAVFMAMKHPQTPLLAKVLAAIAVVYVLSPIDLVPDFIPVIGYLDDVILVPLLIALVLKLIPPDVFAECQQQATELWAEGKPKKWYYALPIIIVWVLVIIWIYNIIWR